MPGCARNHPYVHWPIRYSCCRRFTTRNFGELVAAAAAAAACALNGNNTADRDLADKMVQHRMYRLEHRRLRSAG
jgi:hypothetical protein